MAKSKFIFDLDNTLLTYDTEYQDEFLKEEFGREDPFSGNLKEYMAVYWTNYSRFVDNRLEHFLSFYAGIPIKEGFMQRWVDAIQEMPITLEEGVGDTLEYLKNKRKDLAVLTNWYGDCQIERLKRAGILSYFSGIYSGDFVLKPHLKAYLEASNHYFRNEVVFIGDDIENDYIQPRTFGYDAILYDKREEHPKNLVKIKRIDELKERY